MTGKRAVRRRGGGAASKAPDADAPIGVFDSGIGGLTVLRALTRTLAREQFLYLGDTARVPYGSKSAEVVTRYALEIADFFLERGVKMLVVACNTTSALALEVLRAHSPVPVLGVVEPGARAAARVTRNRRVGVIGTEATIASGAYARALRTLDREVEIFTRPCPLFVPLAEEGWVENEIARRTVALYLASLRRSGIDTLVLGCTHYPLLAGAIGACLGDAVQVVDGGLETAREVRRTLEAGKMLRRRGTGAASFFVTDVPERFVRVGERFYGESVGSAVRVVLRETGVVAGPPALRPARTSG